MLKFLICFLCLLFLTNSAFAEELTFSTSKIQYYDYWNETIKEPHYYITTEYQGLYGVIEYQIRRFVNKYYSDQVNLYFTNQDHRHPCEISDEINNYNALDIKEYIRIRNWTYSNCLLPEHGGLIYCTHIIGKQYDSIKAGPIHITNTGKINFDNWNVYFATKEEDPEEVTPNIEEAKKESLSTNSQKYLRTIRNFLFGFSIPETLKINKYFIFNTGFRINLQLRAFDNNASSIQNISKIILLYKKHPWCAIELVSYFKPLINEYGFNFHISILCF